MSADERRPWEQRPDESSKWYARFTHYLHQGRRRSILSVYRDERGEAPDSKALQTFPSSFGKKANEYEWRARADAYDRAERAREEIEYQERRAENKRLRIEALDALRQAAVDALAELSEKKETMTYGQVTGAVKTATDGLRAEYDDEPTSRRELTGAGGGPITLENANDALTVKLTALAERQRNNRADDGTLPV